MDIWCECRLSWKMRSLKKGAFVNCSEAVCEGSFGEAERLDEGFHCEGQHVVQHLGDQQVEHFRTVMSDGRVCVHLDQPQLEDRVDHEVHPEQLEVELLLSPCPPD